MQRFYSVKKASSRRMRLLAADPGFEPRQTASETAVLPLHKSASHIALVIIPIQYENVNTFSELI